MKLPSIIGHRGARSNAPENTLAGIRHARAEGASWVEFDVKLTKDRVPILIHDETLERTSNGRGPVRDLSLDSIKLVDAGCPAVFGDRFKGERIPTLAEALDLMLELQMGFNLEVKPCPGRERETSVAALALLRQRWPARAPVPIISSFKATSLEAARDTAPELPRGYLAERLETGWLDAVKQLDCTTIHPGHRALTQMQVQRAKKSGYPVLVWTVNEAPRAIELIGWGVDSLISDVPGAIAAAIA